MAECGGRVGGWVGVREGCRLMWVKEVEEEVMVQSRSELGNREVPTEWVPGS